MFFTGKERNLKFAIKKKHGGGGAASVIIGCIIFGSIAFGGTTLAYADEVHNSINQDIQDSGSTIIGENDSSTKSAEYKMIHEIDGTKISNGENSKETTTSSGTILAEEAIESSNQKNSKTSEVEQDLHKDVSGSESVKQVETSDSIKKSEESAVKTLNLDDSQENTNSITTKAENDALSTVNDEKVLNESDSIIKSIPSETENVDNNSKSDNRDLVENSVETTKEIMKEADKTEIAKRNDNISVLNAGTESFNDSDKIRRSKRDNESPVPSLSIQMPVTKEIYENDSTIKGKSEPGVTIKIYKNGIELGSIKADDDGNFEYPLESQAIKSDNYSFVAEKDGAKSIESSVNVVENKEIVGNQRDAYTPYGFGIYNRGLVTTDDGKKHYTVDMEGNLASEAYFDLAGGTMYYSIDEKFAPYVEKIVLDGKTIISKNPYELPNKTNIWSSGILSTDKRGGLVRAALVGRTNGTIDIYFKDDTPQEVLNSEIPFQVWARFKEKKEEVKNDLISDFDLNILLQNNKLILSKDTFFKDEDIVNNNGPKISSNFNYTNNTIDINYGVNTGNYGLTIGKRSPYNLHINTGKELSDLVDTIKIDNKNYEFEKLPDGSLVIKDIYKKGILGGALLNRQEITISLGLIAKKNLGDLIDFKQELLKLDVSIRDNTTFKLVKGEATEAIRKIDSSFDTFKQELTKWIEKRDSNPQEPITINSGDNTSIVDPKEMVEFAVKNPTTENINKARSLVSKMWLWDKNKYNPVLNAAEEVNRYLSTTLNGSSNDDGLILNNTHAATFVKLIDTDKDGILDRYEANMGIGTNYTNADSDGDGKSDGFEIFNDTDPLVSPYDWFDKNGEKIKIVTTDTDTISGRIGNNNYDTENVYPRTVQLIKVTDNGENLISEISSSEDRKGTFEFTGLSGKLSKGDRLVVKIITNEVQREIDRQRNVVQVGYDNPEVSEEVIVQGAQVTVSFDFNYNQTDPDFDRQPVTQVVELEKGSRLLNSYFTPERKGYKFIGWNTDKLGVGQTVNDGSSFNEDITVFAQWEKEPNLAGEVHAPQGPIEEGKSIVLNNVVQSNKSGSVIVTGELPKGLFGLSINETGNLIGTPLINDWIDGENSREVKIPVTISNGDEKVMVEVPLTILHDTRAADAVKAAEDAGKAGADKKAEVETDGLVTPEEKAAVDGLLEIKQSSFMPFENLFSTTNDYSQFPKTGEKSDSILTIYGGLLFLSSIGLLGIKKRKNNTN